MNNAKLMTRTVLSVLLLATTNLCTAQTVVRFTNVQISDQGEAIRANDASVMLADHEGAGRTMLYTGSNMTLSAWVKISAHNVRRSSVKDGAVNAILEIEFYVDGKKDKRRVEKIFYAEQSRQTTVTEKFTFKRGLDVRTVTVSFDLSVE